MPELPAPVIRNEPVASADPIRQRIMDTGERLFSERGYAATSMREITSEAGVNLAAVNYYFGSKENLYIEIIARAVAPINAGRFRLLDAVEAAAGVHPPRVEDILEAFARPCFEISHRPGTQTTLRLLAKSLHENEHFMHLIMEREWKPIAERFYAALLRTLPGASSERLFWAFHFAVGGLIHAVTQEQVLEHLTHGLCRPGDMETSLRRWICFSAAGLRAAVEEEP